MLPARPMAVNGSSTMLYARLQLDGGRKEGDDLVKHIPGRWDYSGVSSPRALADHGSEMPWRTREEV
jgi:hypothetical protein